MGANCGGCGGTWCAPSASLRAVKKHAQADEVSAQSIPLSVNDCGGPNTVATLSGYPPTSVQQGQENFVNAWGTISEDVNGGSMNLAAAMTGFPWTGLGSISNHNICTPATLELRALGIWGGTIDFDGLACPVLMSQGEIDLPIKLALAASLPGGMVNTRADIIGTASNGKDLPCAAVAISRLVSPSDSFSHVRDCSIQ